MSIKIEGGGGLKPSWPRLANSGGTFFAASPLWTEPTSFPGGRTTRHIIDRQQNKRNKNVNYGRTSIMYMNTTIKGVQGSGDIL